MSNIVKYLDDPVINTQPLQFNGFTRFETKWLPFDEWYLFTVSFQNYTKKKIIYHKELSGSMLLNLQNSYPHSPHTPKKPTNTDFSFSDYLSGVEGNESSWQISKLHIIMYPNNQMFIACGRPVKDLYLTVHPIRYKLEDSNE